MANVNLSLPVEKLRNVGLRNLPRLRKLGINTVKDLLWHFPVRYEDYSEIIPISQIENGQKVSVQGEVLKISSRRIFPKRMTITNAMVGDSSGAIRVVWFNQPYIENQLLPGTFVSLAGKVTLTKNGLCLSSPTYEKIITNNSGEYFYPTNNLKHTKGLVPVYPETEGVTSKYLRFLIKPLIESIEVEDSLTDSILEKYNFPKLATALKDIHYPKSIGEAEIAKNRFAFNDLLLFQIKALLERRKMNQLKSISVKFDQALVKGLIEKLPFELTRDQKISLWEILKDLEKNYPMNRLLEGDVGSGKTIVAMIAAYQIAKEGYQSVFMVPTEVLALQHHRTAVSTLENNEEICLLTASEARIGSEKTNKKTLKEKISSGVVKIIIGTHAVIQKGVNFKNLALVVIDEQHRFGINQRKALLANSKDFSKNSNREKPIPHLLSMTATPIPRTLALTIYGDLDISLIREKPKNRQKILTKVVTPSQRSENYRFVRAEVQKGRQVFVVCPRIEINGKDEGSSSDKNAINAKMKQIWADVKAVEEEYKKLSESIFPDLKVAMLHGKMRPKEKNEMMEKFKKHEYDIMVSTSVIEVGVDVPNATIMMIESAERFGLAQLHQFRGRVGRAEHQSYCLLLTSTPDRSVNQRLKALVECDDGFQLAEKDMRIRGPGEFFGVKQSGMPDLAMASLANIDLIKKARNEARLMLKEDPSLKAYPLLKDDLDTFQKMTHFE